MHDTSSVAVRLRQDRFSQRAKELGLSDFACASYIGINHGTLSRVRRGEVMPGERFIALCLSSGFAPSFEWLFTIGERTPAA